MAFTFAAFCYMLTLVLCASLIFFVIWHVSAGGGWGSGWGFGAGGGSGWGDPGCGMGVLGGCPCPCQAASSASQAPRRSGRGRGGSTPFMLPRFWGSGLSSYLLPPPPRLSVPG